jgi:DNA-binding NarL/FixJ family response regulator
MPTILLADDQAMVRAGLRAMLELEPEIEIVGECRDDEALVACRELRPQLLIVDLGMRGKPLAELARALRAEQPALKMLVLTGDLTEKSVRHALAVGVDGYVVKSDEIEELMIAISALLAGECYVSSALAKNLSLPLGDDREVTRNRELTQRELEVLALIGQGLSSAIIAEKLGLAVRTVRKHRENILRKLDMHNMAQLTAYGIKAGLLT